MATIAGHTYIFGRCSCGRWQSEINSLMKAVKADGGSLVGQMDIAHVGALNAAEEEQILKDIEEQEMRIEMAMYALSRNG